MTGGLSGGNRSDHARLYHPNNPQRGLYGSRPARWRRSFRSHLVLDISPNPAGASCSLRSMVAQAHYLKSSNAAWLAA